jgi:hypothetical protein
MDNGAFALAAYGITAAVLIGYVSVLRARLRAAQSEVDREQSDH